MTLVHSGQEAVIPTDQAAESNAPAHTPGEFWCNPREGEFYVTARVTATIYETITASSKEEARAKMEARFDAQEIDVCGSDIDEARIDFIQAEQPMYLVHRPGTTVNGTSRIQPGDEPREPKDDYERRTYTRPPYILKATTPGEAGAVGMEAEGRNEPNTTAGDRT